MVEIKFMHKIALYIPSMSGGGAEKVFMILANYFISQGYHVDLLLTKKRGVYLKDLDNRINIIQLSSKRSAFDLPYLLNYLNSYQPKVLLSALTHSNIIAIASSLLTRSKVEVFVSEHSNFTNNTKSMKFYKLYIMKLFIKYFYKYAKGIICVSDGVKKDFHNLFPFTSDKTITIYNPFETLKIKTNSLQSVDHPWLSNCRKFKTIISSGRLHDAKDYYTLLKSISLLRKNCDVRLIILGEGDLRGGLSEFININKLNDIVDLFGFVDNPFSYIAKSDVFVLSSKYEGLPNVLIESMICGVPLVSTDCESGPAEILEEGKWGKLVPVGDADALAKAIYEILNEKKLRDYSYRIKSFDHEYIGQKYLKFMLN